MFNINDTRIKVESISAKVYKNDKANYVAWLDGDEEWGSATGETITEAKANLVEDLNDQYCAKEAD